MDKTALTICFRLFGKQEHPFIYDVLKLDEGTTEPLLIRHDGRGNIQYAAKWNGDRWIKRRLFSE